MTLIRGKGNEESFVIFISYRVHPDMTEEMNVPLEKI